MQSERHGSGVRHTDLKAGGTGRARSQRKKEREIGDETRPIHGSDRRLCTKNVYGVVLTELSN